MPKEKRGDFGFDDKFLFGPVKGKRKKKKKGKKKRG